VNLSIAATAIRSEFHLSNTRLDLVFSAFGYGYAGFQIAGGWIGDRLSARRTLTCFLILWPVVTIFIGFATGLASLVFARVSPASPKALHFPMPHAPFPYGCLRGAAVLPRESHMPAPGSAPPSHHRSGNGGDAVETAHPAHGADDRRVFLPGWTFWIFLIWIPTFLLSQYHVDIKSSVLFTFGVFLSGVVGDLLGGVVTDRILKRIGNLATARRNMIMLAFAGAAVFVTPVIFLRHDVVLVALCLSGSLFSLDLMIGPIWSVPIDIAPAFARTASGLMNTGSAVPSILTPQIFVIIVDCTGNWNIPFLGSLIFLLIGFLLTLLIHPERQLQVPAGPPES